MSLAIWNHTLLPATRHKWIHLALTAAGGWQSTYLPRTGGRLCDQLHGQVLGSVWIWTMKSVMCCIDVHRRYDHKCIRSSLQSQVWSAVTLKTNTNVLQIRNYTVGHKKMCHFYFYDDNFGKCGPISIILSLLDSQINCGIRWNKIFHRTWILLPLYLVKVKCSNVQHFIHTCMLY